MKVPILLQSILTGLGFAAILAVILLSLVMSCQRELKAVLDRFNGSRWTKRLLCVAAIGLLTCYAGFKHQLVTNPPPDDASSPTNAVEESKSEVEVEQWNLSTCASGLEEEGNILRSPSTSCFAYSSPSPSTYASIANWTARGAYCDWERIEFRDAFRFPVGTNFIDSVTLMAWGELRLLTANSQALTALPSRVSLEPGVSSVTHGLTASNSYLFAWHNCCVGRSATNRVDASIELFRNGAVAIRTSSDVQPSTFDFRPPIVPEGYYGHGQDEAWIRANFPAESTNILAKGYANWLADEWVGVNEENGHFQTAITVASLPADGGPCYLACGPYKVNVTAAGTYRFPLEVFETYTVRAFPSDLQLSYAHDDGYRGAGTSFEIIEPDSAAPAPRPRLMGSAISELPISVILSDLYRFYMNPTVVPLPDFIYLEDGRSERVRFWCNMLWVSRTFYWANYARIAFHGRSEAVVYEALEAEVAYIGFEFGDKLALGLITIEPEHVNDSSSTNSVHHDGQVFIGEPYHPEQTNDLSILYVTAVTEHGTTNEVLETDMDILQRGKAVYVGVYMATIENVLDVSDCRDDRVTWSVLANGGEILGGSATVFEKQQELRNAHLSVHGLYGILGDPIYLGGCRVEAPDDGQLDLRLVATAQNADDGLSETCLQIVVFPIDENGNVVGLPNGVH